MRRCSTLVTLYTIKRGDSPLTFSQSGRVSSEEIQCGDEGVLCPSCRELRARDKLAEEREKAQ